MCCYTTLQGACCGGNSKAGGGCCTQDETCCSDDEDYSCCMQQSTYCVQKDPSVPSLPSRCCPRWTVGCTTGSVGCCDPAQPWQWFLASTSTKNNNSNKGHKREHQQPHQTRFVSSNGDADLSAYALLVSGVSGGLEGWKINVGTGAIEARTRVIKGFDDDPAGESTREFMFDSKRKLFYYVDANFTANGGARPAGGREMYLYTVDPVGGTTHKQTVSGAVDFPVGYSYHAETDAIILGVEKLTTNETLTGFDFFSLNPDTAVATRLSTISRGASESDPDYYSGFHRHASIDGNTLYRLGYEMVKEQTGQGLGVLALNEAHATAQWLSEISPLHDYYMTLNRLPGSNNTKFGTATDEFVSLAPRKGIASQNHDLDLVRWNADDGGKSAKIIAQLNNAHVPAVMRLGTLGYLASAVTADTFAALVVADEKISDLDRWALAVVDLTPGANNSAVLPLTPDELSGTISISGLGLA